MATPRQQPANLWAVLPFVFLNSLGSGVLSTGIYFLAKENFHFSKGFTFLLGVVYGITYIPGALLVGPLLKKLPILAPRLSPRSVLAIFMLFGGVVCWVPWLAALLLGDSTPPAWTLWSVVALYSPMSGGMWPMVEAFVSGGRKGPALRSAIGRFNVVWSSAVLVALLAMAPLVEKQAMLVLQSIGVVHLLSALCLLGFPAWPAGHIHDEHAPHPPIYSRLLVLLQVLMPTAFIVLSAMSPYLPTAREQIGLRVDLATALPSTWMASRVITFFLLERWHGWHGRWSTPFVGMSLLLGGFAAVVLAPVLLAGPVAAIVLFAGLAAFGVGLGIIYCATLYYTQSVGAAEVEAGGTFEMLIGIGYTVGPLCGVAAVGLADRGALPATGVEPAMLAIVSVIAVLGVALALRVASKARGHAD